MMLNRESARETGTLLRRVTARYELALSDGLATLDLTIREFETLEIAASMTSPTSLPTQDGLRSSCDCGLMTMSRILKGLEDKRLIGRFRDLSDPRSNVVEITSKGTAALLAAQALVSTIEEEMFGPPGHTGGILFEVLCEIDDRDWRALGSTTVR